MKRLLAGVVSLIIASSSSIGAKPSASHLRKIGDNCRSRGDQKACQEIARIAKHDRDRETRIAAVQQMSDQAELTDLVLNDPDQSIRLAAFENLASADALARITLESRDSSLRTEAYRRILARINPGTSLANALAKIAMEDSDPSVRRDAVDKLSDQAQLAKLATNAEDHEVRLAALKKLEDVGSEQQAGITQPAPEDKGEARIAYWDNDLDNLAGGQVCESGGGFSSQCKAYAGPKLPKGEIAIISWNSGRLQLAKVDGKPALMCGKEQHKEACVGSGFDSVGLLPGPTP